MAQNVDYKKSKLDEEASIYAKRDEGESERSRWSKMNRKQKWIHFKAYYLRVVVIGVLILVVAGFFLYKDVIHKTEIVYRCAVINEIATEPQLLAFADGFLESMNIDTDRNQASFHMYYTNNDVANDLGASVSSDLTQVSSMIYAGTLDSMIAGQVDFDGYQEKGFFADLTEVLTEEQLAKLENRLYIPDVPENEEGHPYGVYLDQNDVYGQIFEGGGGIVEKPILGIFFNSKKQDMSVKLLEYLFR